MDAALIPNSKSFVEISDQVQYSLRVEAVAGRKSGVSLVVGQSLDDFSDMPPWCIFRFGIEFNDIPSVGVSKRQK